jgi:hypothetical protein
MADLSAFTLYNNRSLGGIGAEEINTPQAQQMLQQLRQYDPNANFRPSYGSDGQLLGYTLDVDASTLPGASGTGSLGGTSGHGSGADFMPSFSTVQDNMHLMDPNAVTNSPIYGKITDNRNIQQEDDWIAKWGGPLLVSMFAFGAPALAAAMSNGAIGGAAAASGAGAGAGSFDSGVGYDPWVEAGQSIPGSGAAAGGSLPGGLGSGAADELANGGQYVAGAPAASQTSIDVSNWMAAHGIPTQFGLSEGATGAAMSEPLLGLGGTNSLLSNAGKVVSGLTSGGGAGGGSGGGGGGGLLAQPYNMQPYKSLTALLRQYGDRGLLG